MEEKKGRENDVKKVKKIYKSVVNTKDALNFIIYVVVWIFCVMFIGGLME